MSPTQPQKDIFSKNKKLLLSFFILFLFFGASSFILFNGNKNNTDSADLNIKNMEINDKTLSLAEETFKKNLNIALTEPKLKALATSFKETCNPGDVGSATFGNSITFKELVQSVEPIKENLNGESLLIIPCGQGSYQSYYIIALYDGKTYEPLQIPSVSEDGKINYYYSAVEAGYDPKTNIVSTSASFNGMRTCGESVESKLIGKKLILQKYSVDWDCQNEELNEKVIYDINQAPSKIDYPPSGGIDFEKMVRVNNKVFNIYITSTPSAPPESGYCGGGLERYIYIFNEQKNKQLFVKNIDSCLNNIYLSDFSPDRMFQGNSIVFRWDAIDEKINVKGVIDLSTDPINYSETNIIVGKQSTVSTSLKSERAFTFENFTYDFSSVRCDPGTSSEIKIIYHDKERKRLFVSFDCYHGATGNTNDAFYRINLVDHSTQLISTDYVLYPIEDNYRISPNNKYLLLGNAGNSGGCGLYSVIGLVDLEKFTVLEINPPSADYSYLNSDTVVVSVLDSLPDNKTSTWDKEGNFLFIRKIYGCSSATTEFDGGFYTIFTEKWSYNPDKNTYTLTEKIKN